MVSSIKNPNKIKLINFHEDRLTNQIEIRGLKITSHQDIELALLDVMVLVLNYFNIEFNTANLNYLGGKIEYLRNQLCLHKLPLIHSDLRGIEIRKEIFSYLSVNYPTNYDEFLARGKQK